MTTEKKIKLLKNDKNIIVEIIKEKENTRKKAFKAFYKIEYILKGAEIAKLKNADGTLGTKIVPISNLEIFKV